MMESLSRARKKPKNDNSGSGNHGESTTIKQSVEKHSIKSEKASFSAASFSSSRGSDNKRLSVKEIIMPLHSSGNTGSAGHHIPRNHERKYVRDNYPAVAAYLDHQRQPLSRVENVRAFRPASMNAPPLPAMVPREREKSYRGYERLYANIGPDSIYATPAASTSSMVSSVSSSVQQNVNSPSSGSSTAAGSHPECGCYRHCQPKENDHNHGSWTWSDHCVDLWWGLFNPIIVGRAPHQTFPPPKNINQSTGSHTMNNFSQREKWFQNERKIDGNKVARVFPLLFSCVVVLWGTTINVTFHGALELNTFLKKKVSKWSHHHCETFTTDSFDKTRLICKWHFYRRMFGKKWAKSSTIVSQWPK